MVDGVYFLFRYYPVQSVNVEFMNVVKGQVADCIRLYINMSRVIVEKSSLYLIFKLDVSKLPAPKLSVPLSEGSLVISFQQVNRKQKKARVSVLFFEREKRSYLRERFIPARPKSAEPINHAAAGTGTAEALVTERLS